MSTIAVQQQVIPDIFDVRLTAANPPHLRVFCSVAFTSNDVPPVYVPNGSVGGGKYYIDVACTYVAATGTVTVPTFNLISTTDALAPAQNASYTFCLFTSSGQQLNPDPVQSQMYQIRVPATYKSASSCSPLNKCMDWRDLMVFSRGPFNPNLDLSAYTKSEIDAKFAALGSAGAPSSEKYVVQVADLAQIPNAFSLGTLGTGLLKNTTIGATGTPSIGVAGTDYQAPLIVTTPLTLTGGATLGLAGLTTLGTANQLVGMDPTATVYEYKTLSTGTTGSDFNIANSAGSIVFNIPTAGAATRGVIANTGTLSLGTQLTFSAGAGTGILVGANATIALGTNVVTSVVNDTNVTGSIAANALTLGWTGQLAKARIIGTAVYSDQANTYSTGLQDFTLATLKVPNGAGMAPTTSALIAYDTTANRFNGGVNGANQLLVTPSSTDTFTNKTWNGVVIAPQYGGTGQVWTASSGLPSFNAGTASLNAITTNGVAYGAATNAINFTSAVANGVLVTSAGNVPSIAAPGVSLSVSGSVLNTIQNIRTTDTPQFAAMGLNQGVAAVTILGILGPTMTTQSDQSVGSLQTGLNLTKNDGNTRTFFDTLIKPTINTGAGNSATTLNVLTVDTINTVITGVTTNLLRVNYGGANQFNLTSAGAATIATSLAVGGGTALTTTNQTGTGSLVLATSPTLVTPTLGVALATSINGLTITTSTGTLTITNAKTASFSNTLTFAGVDGKTATFNNSITFTGTDATTMTFPTTSATIARTDAGQTFTGTQVFGALTATSVTGLTSALTPNAAGGTDLGSTALPFANLWIGGSATNNFKITGTATAARVFTLLDTASDTFAMIAATQTLTNKTIGATTTITGPVTMTLGSDATGDVYYRSAGGLLTRLGIGSAGQFIGVSAGIPAWATPAGTGGTINSATINQMAFYSAATTISGNSGIVTDGFNTLSTSPTARTSGSPTYYFRVVAPADTTLAASVESIGSQFGGTTGLGTVTRQFSTGGLATQRENVFVAPTYSFVAASNLTTPATVAITDGPIAGTNATFTGGFGQGLSLWSQHGQVEFDHTINMTTAQTTFAIPVLNITLTTSGANAGGNPTPAGQRIAVTAAGTSAANASLGLAISMNNNTNPGAESAALFTATYNQFGSNSYAMHGQCFDQTVGATGTTEANLSGVFSTVVRAVAITGAKTAHSFIAESTGSQHADVAYGFSQRAGPGGAFDYALDQCTTWGVVNNVTPAIINKAFVRAAHGTLALASRNQANGADIPLIQLGALGGQNNSLLLGNAATVTTTTSPITIMWAGATSLGNAVGTSGTFGFQTSDASSTIVFSASVGAGPSFRTFRADGTSAALTAIASGDVIGSYQVFGYDGTVATGSVATIFRGLASQNWTNAAHGAHGQVFTVPDSTISSVETVRFMSMGPLQIANNAAYGAGVGPVAGDMVGGSQAAAALYVHGNKIAFAYSRAGIMHFLTYDMAAGAGSWADGTTPP